MDRDYVSNHVYLGLVCELGYVVNNMWKKFGYIISIAFLTACSNQFKFEIHELLDGEEQAYLEGRRINFVSDESFDGSLEYAFKGNTMFIQVYAFIQPDKHEYIADYRLVPNSDTIIIYISKSLADPTHTPTDGHLKICRFDFIIEGLPYSDEYIVRLQQMSK